MQKQSSKWLTKELAKVFSEGVRGVIPGANLQLEIISKLTNVWCPAASSILDLGCGDGILGRMLLDAYPEAYMVFADFSEPMLAKVRRKVGSNIRASVIHLDFATPAWLKSVEAETPFDIIVDVECFFKTFELALFGGRKKSKRANSPDAKSRTAD